MDLSNKIVTLLGTALSAREYLLNERHESAFRLFNGFYEGFPELAVDLYSRTLVIHNYADPPESGIPVRNNFV